jgi:hypothetical protein
MRFIQEIEIDKSEKKVVSARIPSMILNALDTASPVLKDEFGFKFSIPEIVEKALFDTLEEIKNETGLDFYGLEKFKKDMNQLKIRLEEGAPGLNIEFDDTITNNMIIDVLIGKGKIDSDSVIERYRRDFSENMHSQFDYFVKAMKPKVS